MSLNYEQKYLKYKQKYLTLKRELEGGLPQETKTMDFSLVLEKRRLLKNKKSFITRSYTPSLKGATINEINELIKYATEIKCKESIINILKGKREEQEELEKFKNLVTGCYDNKNDNICGSLKTKCKEYEEKYQTTFESKLPSIYHECNNDGYLNPQLHKQKALKQLGLSGV
jgi:hypothetical protein